MRLKYGEYAGMTMEEWIEKRKTLMPRHPAPDLDAPAPAGDDRPIARGFIQVEPATWLRLEKITRVAFNTGEGPDYCAIWLADDQHVGLSDDDARAFWVAWTRYLAGDD